MILDLGCGDVRTGAVGLDIRRAKGVDVLGDAHHLPFSDGVFFGCIIDSCLEHVDNPLLVLMEVYRVLKHEASLNVVVPRRSLMPFYQAKLLVLLRWRRAWKVQKSLQHGTHKWQFSKTGLTKLLRKCGFSACTIHFLLAYRIPFSGNIIAEATKN